jgi:hypothetical protein
MTALSVKVVKCFGKFLNASPNITPLKNKKKYFPGFEI